MRGLHHPAVSERMPEVTKKTAGKAMPAAAKIEINPGFRRALDIMEGTPHHVFITGKAGTGKSTLLELWRGQTLKRIAVLAPTGVAALNVRGQTIHSFFGFKPDVTPEAVRKLAKGRGAAADRVALYRNLDAIVIDEVSMVRADLMDCVEKFLRLNGPRPKEWFGGLQMVFIGDLYQLPPVVTGQERGLFAPDPPSLRRGFGPAAGPSPASLSAARYESPYFFSARIFAEPDFAMDFIELEKVYRQSDAAFIGLLNAIRNRSIDEEQIALLNSRLDPAFSPPDGEFYITLTSTNDLAAARNREKLASLSGRTRRYEGLVEGEFDRRSFPTEEALELKKGAQVMLLTNDRRGRYVNGTIGRVAKITKVPDEDDVVTVELPDGDEVDLSPNTWEIFRFQYDSEADRIESESVGSFTQYPLRLAWAVTIHKSQGKTFDRVVVDIGRGAFAHGQVYVALSRCTSFEGLVLRTPIRKSHIWMDWRIVRFLTRFQYKKAEEALPAAGKRALLLEAIRDGRELEIVYLKPDDTKSRRRIKPESVETMEYHGKTFEGVRAFCHKRGECRTFRLDRILEIC
jgi:ATP-dependent DNA helicase PIF1